MVLRKYSVWSGRRLQALLQGQVTSKAVPVQAVAFLHQTLRVTRTICSAGLRVHFASRILAVLLLWIASHGVSACAEELQSDFEGQTPSWKAISSDLNYKLDYHRRVHGEGRDGRTAEVIRVSGSGGTAIYIGHYVTPARVLDELQPSVWIKADRPDLQILARVVLPHSVDLRTGEPRRAYISGDNYKSVGSWQQLRITDAPRSLARQIRVLRQSSHDIDAREAYVDQILLNVYGGPGSTEVLIDDLAISGLVTTNNSEVQIASAEEPITKARRTAELSGSLLLVDGYPYFVRCIQHQGEPLEFLARVGFNAVLLTEAPSSDVLLEASRHGLWLICPPPQSSTIGDEYDSVLAWHLGEGLSRRELALTAERAKALRQSDALRSRPIICNAETELRAYSRHIDVLISRRRPLSSSLELNDYGTWLQNCPRLAQPGTPWWSTIQTQPAADLLAQMQALSPEAASKARLDDEAIRLMVHTAVAAGMRGLVFESNSRLDGTDLLTLRRAAVLELINLELKLLEPWAAGGTPATVASSNNPDITGAVLQTDKARLILPVRSGAGSQYVPMHTPGEISFLVPGIPQADEVYELTPAGPQALRQKRVVAGGILMTLENFGLTSTIVTTSDLAVYGGLYKRLSSLNRRAAELERKLITQSLAELQYVHSQLGSNAAVADLQSRIAGAQGAVERAETLAAAGDHRAALAAQTSAASEARRMRRDLWQRVGLSLGSPMASPLAACFATLPEHAVVAEQLRTGSLGPNRVEGGSFENLDLLLAAGWRHYELVQPDAVTMVELSAKDPHSAPSSLRLAVKPAGEKSNNLIETPPLWVTSAPVPVQAGEVLCIRGRVKIEAPITGSVDGLMIVDSLGGEALAQRMGETGGWQEFVLFRAARESGTMTVTFALTGLGEARLDDFSVQAVGQSGSVGVQHARIPGRGPMRLPR